MIKRSGIMVKLSRVKTLLNFISDVCFLYKQILLSEEMWELQTYL